LNFTLYGTAQKRYQNSEEDFYRAKRQNGTIKEAETKKFVESVSLRDQQKLKLA
jgi:hypothetical protein